MHTIQEFSEFVRDAAKLLTEDELADLLTYVAFDPTRGDLIPGSGGFRKLRWGRQGKGKRGGVRTVYFYYDENIPISMVAIYAKNAKENLSRAEINELYASAQIMKGVNYAR